MEYNDILKFGEIQYLIGRLDELYKGFVPRNTSTDNRIVDSRISKYENKLRSVDEVSYYLYMTEKKNKLYSKNKNKEYIKELLLKVSPHVDNEELIKEIKKQIDKY